MRLQVGSMYEFLGPICRGEIWEVIEAGPTPQYGNDGVIAKLIVDVKCGATKETSLVAPHVSGLVSEIYCGVDNWCYITDSFTYWVLDVRREAGICTD